MHSTPGMHTSEFLLTILNAVAMFALAATNTISSGSGIKYGVVGGLAYVISRGLAKYEARGTTTPPTP